MSKRNAWLISGSLAFLLIGVPSKAETADEVVIGLQEKYEQMESFSAEFDQIFQSRVIQLKESGIVMMKKPGKMYWEYQKPTSKFFVADGQRSYFYVPRDRQAIISELNLSEIQTPLLFLLGKGDIQEDFQVEFEEQEEALDAGATPDDRHPRDDAESEHLGEQPARFGVEVVLADEEPQPEQPGRKRAE